MLGVSFHQPKILWLHKKGSRIDKGWHPRLDRARSSFLRMAGARTKRVKLDNVQNSTALPRARPAWDHAVGSSFVVPGDYFTVSRGLCSTILLSIIMQTFCGSFYDNVLSRLRASATQPEFSKHALLGRLC